MVSGLPGWTKTPSNSSTGAAWALLAHSIAFAQQTKTHPKRLTMSFTF